VITKEGQGSWGEKEEERQRRLNAEHTECAQEEQRHVHRRLRSCVC